MLQETISSSHKLSYNNQIVLIKMLLLKLELLALVFKCLCQHLKTLVNSNPSLIKQTINHIYQKILIHNKLEYLFLFTFHSNLQMIQQEFNLQWLHLCFALHFRFHFTGGPFLLFTFHHLSLDFTYIGCILCLACFSSALIIAIM